MNKFDYVPKFGQDGRRASPWVEKGEPTIVPFATVRNQAGVEDVIRRAQVATLNPRTDPAAYTDQSPIKVGFSPNLIVLNVSASKAAPSVAKPGRRSRDHRCRP
jgi:hypothetical protein